MIPHKKMIRCVQHSLQPFIFHSFPDQCSSTLKPTALEQVRYIPAQWIGVEYVFVNVTSESVERWCLPSLLFKILFLSSCLSFRPEYMNTINSAVKIKCRAAQFHASILLEINEQIWFGCYMSNYSAEMYISGFRASSFFSLRASAHVGG